MSDIVTLNGYKIKDEKAVRSYESIAQMKADRKLKEGYHVKTKGYYEANDGGHGEYVIVDDDTLVSDGGSIHVLTNGLRAKLIIKDGIINIHQFGAKGNGINDDYDAIINVLNYIKSNETKTEIKSYLTLNFLPKTYYLGNVVEYDEYIDNLKINGNGAVITGNGFKFGTKIGLKVNIDNLNFKNVDVCYNFDYIDRNFQTLIFTNSIFKGCNNIFKINRRSCMVKFENCKFIGMNKAMILNNVDKVEISNCWFQTSGNTVDDYSSVIEQTGDDEGWIDVHNSFFIPQLKGNYISWFKINKKLTFHENRASGELPNQIALVYTSSDMDTPDISHQRYVINIHDNPILDTNKICILNGIPHMLNISNNAGYHVVSNKLIIWDPTLTEEEQNNKLQAKISNFNIKFSGNSFGQFNKNTGDINLPSSVMPIIPDNLLSFVQRKYRSVNNQVQNRIISKTMNNEMLTELKVQLYDISSYAKKMHTGFNFLFAYNGYISGSPNASYMLDIISLNHDNSISKLKIDVKTIVGNRISSEDYSVTFEDGSTTVDTTVTPNPIIVIKSLTNRNLAYAQFSELQLEDILSLGQL